MTRRTNLEQFEKPNLDENTHTHTNFGQKTSTNLMICVRKSRALEKNFIKSGSNSLQLMERDKESWTNSPFFLSI